MVEHSPKILASEEKATATSTNTIGAQRASCWTFINDQLFI